MVDRVAFGCALVTTLILALVAVTREAPRAAEPRHDWGLYEVKPCRKAPARSLVPVGDDAYRRALEIGMDPTTPPLAAYQALRDVAQRTATPEITERLGRNAQRAAVRLLAGERFADAREAVEIAERHVGASTITQAVRAALAERGY